MILGEWEPKVRITECSTISETHQGIHKTSGAEADTLVSLRRDIKSSINLYAECGGSLYHNWEHGNAAESVPIELRAGIWPGCRQ